MRTHLIHIVLKRTPIQLILPFAVAYVILPTIGVMSYQSSGAADSQRMMIYAVQIFLPICALLWPMAYMQMWVDDDCIEALIACNHRHKSCLAEILLLYLLYVVMLLPPSAVFFITYGFLPLEYVRIAVQCLFATTVFYTATMLFRNVTLGSLPIITYLFICICFSGNTDFQALSIIKPTAIYTLGEMVDNYSVYVFASTLLLCIFAFGRNFCSGRIKQRR